MRHTIVVSLLIALVCNTATAEVLPAEQWTPEARLTLARALVAEATWSRIDHAAIAWVLQKRWRQRQQRRPTWTFEEQVTAYCSGMRLRSKRTAWFRSLPENPVASIAPVNWPSKREWAEYVPHWERVLVTVDQWQAGDVVDPCRGKAIHWGSVEDSSRPTRGGWRAVACGPTRNIFWRHGPTPQRSALARGVP